MYYLQQAHGNPRAVEMSMQSAAEPSAQTTDQPASASRAKFWAAWILGTLPALLLLLGAVMDLIKAPAAVQGSAKYGYPETSMLGIGLAALFSAVLYLV